MKTRRTESKRWKRNFALCPPKMGEPRDEYEKRLRKAQAAFRKAQQAKAQRILDRQIQKHGDIYTAEERKVIIRCLIKNSNEYRFNRDGVFYYGPLCGFTIFPPHEPTVMGKIITREGR
jgi:hypothetical protein